MTISQLGLYNLHTMPIKSDMLLQDWRQVPSRWMPLPYSALQRMCALQVAIQVGLCLAASWGE